MKWWIVVALCGAATAPPALAEGTPATLAAHARRYLEMFDEAAREFDVPAELLQSIAYAETRWHPHVPKGQARQAAEPEVEIVTHGGMPPGYGIMGLHDDSYFGYSLSAAAALLGVAPALLYADTRTNIRAAAALLAQLGQRKTRAVPLEEWEDALARYSGIPQRESAQLYTYEVLAAIGEGRQSDQFRIRQRDVQMEKIYGEETLKKLSARQNAIWSPAPPCNYSARSGTVSHVTVHTTQGSYASAISWFQSCSAGVSAHYVIRASDGQVTQMVREADKAWHVGTSNDYTIGIEHEGYIGDPGAWYTSAMYAASARLTKSILAARSLAQTVYDGSGGWNAVLPDVYFDVKGHVNYANQAHSDPGPGWDWARYRNLVTDGAPGDAASHP
jgi:N-acetyl-anhydromuramyl-L-alanine amidase AmpD